MTNIRPELLEGFRERVEALLEKAECTPSGEWHISDAEHALMVQLSEVFGVTLPVSAFRSSEGAASFLRLARAALGGFGPPGLGASKKP